MAAPQPPCSEAWQWTQSASLLFDVVRRGARAGEPNDANAMALATATPDGRPSVRMVLLKGHGPNGLRVLHQAESRKGGEIAANPHAALAVPLEGAAPADPHRRRGREVDDGRSGRLFRLPRAAIRSSAPGRSDQSRPLDSRDDLRERVRRDGRRFDGEEVPRPPHWAGFALTPERIEFWIDRPHRLHERRLFTPTAMAGPKGCSTHEAADCRSRRADPRAALASVAMALTARRLKIWRALADGIDGDARLARRQRRSISSPAWSP